MLLPNAKKGKLQGKPPQPQETSASFTSVKGPEAHQATGVYQAEPTPGQGSPVSSSGCEFTLKLWFPPALPTGFLSLDVLGAVIPDSGLLGAPEGGMVTGLILASGLQPGSALLAAGEEQGVEKLLNGSVPVIQLPKVNSHPFYGKEVCLEQWAVSPFVSEHPGNFTLESFWSVISKLGELMMSQSNKILFQVQGNAVAIQKPRVILLLWKCR